MKAIFDGTNFIDEKGLVITKDNYQDITELEVLGSVTEIEDEAFMDLTNLKYCKIDEGVKVIGSVAFMDLENVERIDLPEGLDFIKPGAFTRCISMKELIIPSTVTEACEITNGINLEKIIVDKNNKCYDSRNNCNAIIDSRTNVLETGCKNTIIPEGVKGIENFAFETCIGLKSMVFPRSLEFIGSFAFAGCEDMKSVYIPKTLFDIADDAFPENEDFTIYYEGSEEDWEDAICLDKDKYKVVFNYKF